MCKKKEINKKVSLLIKQFSLMDHTSIFFYLHIRIKYFSITLSNHELIRNIQSLAKENP